MTTEIVLYTLMFAAFFGMLWANNQYKAKGVLWARPLAAAFGIVSLLMALVTIIMQIGGSGVNAAQMEAFLKKEARYQFIAYKKLGKCVAEKHAGSKILLIKYRDPISKIGEEEININQAKLEGLKEGLGGAVEIAVEIAVEEGNYDGRKSANEMMENMLSAEKMDQYMKKNKNCKVILSLVGLPYDFEAMEFWRMGDSKNRPVLVLGSASLYDLKEPMKYGFISAALCNKPIPVDIDKDVSDDEDEAFNSRFLLITPETVDSVASEFPKMF